MREILFRGKDANSGEWVYGYYAHFKNMLDVEADIIYTGYADRYMGSLLPEYYDVKPETVGQYTGLTDKNGKRIFENDICRFDNDEPNEAERYTNYVIQWDIVNCRFVVVTADNCEDVLDRFFSEKSEIIANIHDNPELLGAGNEIFQRTDE